MHDVTAALSDDFAEYRHAEQRQIADDVEYLVTHEFISKAQTGFVQHSFRRQHDRIVE